MCALAVQFRTMSRSLGATHLHLFTLCALAVQFPGSQKFVTKGEVKVTGSNSPTPLYAVCFGCAVPEQPNVCGQGRSQGHWEHLTYTALCCVLWLCSSQEAKSL